LGAPLAALGQQAAGKVALIGLLDFGTPDAGRLNWWQAFRQGLRELGYVEGQNIRFEARWAQGRLDRLPGLAAELVRLPVDVIVTGGGEAARAAKQATSTIPIVMASGGDPVKLGVVESLARPGGNVTGVTSLSSQLIAKRVELLGELLPKVSRVAILWDETPNSRISVQELDAAGRTLGIGVHPVGVRGPNDFARAFSETTGERALIVVASPVLFTERKRIADLALKHRLPTAVGGREYAEAGGLFPYAVSYPELFQRAAGYVDKILRGAKPADLPVEQPTIPQSLLQRANHLIE